eukprot:XP_011681326.1 PREDICTED: sacsin-like [Strongylocentrotus purpuratus]
MVRLLESFVDDADVVLLFLRSLETIDISRRIDQAHTQIRSRVEICPKSLALMKSERESFSHALEENSKKRIGQRTRACLTHQLTLTMQVAESKRRMDWIVSQIVGGSELNDDVVSITDKHGYLPWVGVAMPYNMPHKRRDDFSGRVFCFLPLPPGDESLTGLPVHIHGFFGVNSDRRSIKWPGADRVQGDIDAKWNFLLVTKLLPDAYMNMLTFAIKEQKLPPDEIYRAWPDPDQVRPQWELLLKPIYQLLSKHTVIYTMKGNEMGQWVKIQDAVFNFLTDVDENTERILLTVLKAANIPVAEVPQHIKKIIQSKDCINFNAKVISPEVIIDCIHKSQHGVLETLSSDDKLVLLEYIMTRTKTPRLIGLKLLPLANGDFVPFATRSASTRTVFIPTRELDKTMCYNMGNSLILPNLNTDLLKLLEKAAEHGSVQLQMMSDKNLARLIRDTLPKEWFATDHGSTVLWHPGKGNQPPREWLKGIWKLLNTCQRNSIEKYVDLPLIQVEELQSGEVVLAFLKRNSTCISQSYGSDKFDRPEEVVLTKIGLVICSCPTFIDTALLIGGSYLRSPSKKGVIGALTAVPDPKALQKTIKGLSKKERQVLVRFFTSCSLTDVERNFLRQIPLFDTIPRTPSDRGRVVSASDVSLAFCRTSTDRLPKHHLPEYDMICCNDDAILKLFSDLEMMEKQRKELLKDIVEAICCDISDKTVFEDVGMWILRDLKSIKRDIGNHLLKLKSQGFILTGAGELKSPDSLFDPEDRYMPALFSKGFFPSARYVDEGLLGSLRELGLRHQRNVTAIELARLVEEITSENNIKKADVFMSFLGEYQNKLKEPLAGESDQTLQQFLADKKCIPCLMKSPDFYPQGIPWHRSERQMISPTETVIPTKVNILASGATIPFPKKTVPHTLLRSLGVKEHPNIKNTLEQMAVVLRCHGIAGTSDSSRKLEKMVHGLYSLLSTARKEDEVILKLTTRLPACIWTGTGFVEIHRAILSSRENAFHPYISSIPQEFSTKYEHFFLALGVKRCISETQIHEIIIQIQKSEPKLGSVEKRMKFCRENKRVVQKALILLDEICEGDLSRQCQNILVPTNNEHFLELVDPRCCVFEDVKGRGDSDEVQEKLKKDNTFIVDGTLPIGIVRALGILPLSQKILAAKELTGIEQAGQHGALRGEISDEHYDEQKCKSLLASLWRSSEDLLVFTKNIQEVKAFVLLPNATHPSESSQLFAIEKESEGGRDIMAEFKQSTGDTVGISGNPRVTQIQTTSRDGMMQAVFEDIISKAYVTLLANQEFQRQVAKMASKVRISGVNSSPDNFYRLWPNAFNITQGSDGYAMLKGFYTILVASDSHDANIFWEGDRTWSFKEAIFIDPLLLESPHVASAVKKVLQMQHTKRIVTEMPKEIRSTLDMLGLGEQLKRHTCSKHDFFQKYFLPQISVFQSEVRDHLIHYCLSNVELLETLRTIACIPTSPDGKNLKRPSELIHPNGKASILFAEEDGRFPYGSFANLDCLHFLVHLGMVQDDISSTDLIKYVQKLQGKPIDYRQDRVLVEYLTYRLKKENSSWAKDESLRNQLNNIAFIPVTYMNSSMRKASRDTIYGPEKLSLVSEVALVLDESKFRVPHQVRRFLGIVQNPAVDVVLQQLQSISSRPENVAHLRSVCLDIYRFLDLRLKEDVLLRKGDAKAQIQEFFHSPTTKECLLVGKMFRSADHLAWEFEEEYVGSHLFRVSYNLHGFDALLSTIDMKARFSTQDFLSTLKCIYDSTSGKLNKSEFKDVMKLLKCLINGASENSSVMSGVLPNDIYVPDSNSYLRIANELSFCDVDWISIPDGVIIAHSDIPFTWAKILGVQDIRQHILENYSVPVPGLGPHTLEAQNLLPFGQREPLTERIKNILKGYPCDDTILKELVQNADDSCATEVHLVLDVRTHPKDRLFRDEMSSLQGPALCVYNNRSFTDADIEGIQRLGVGSKRNLSSKVGRFGVGFNAVYHLTDCPSFYTNGDTLGMFDPNVRFVPNATLARPGFMAKPTGKLKDDFPNVFNFYLPEFFEGQGSTMFRLPLRTESMARTSDISSKAHDVDSVKRLMRKFKEGLPDLLLFLKHIKKVSISTIDEQGNMKDTSSVQASISESNQLDLDAFVSSISPEETDPVTVVSKSLEDIPVTEVHYDMRVTVKEQQAKGVKTQSEDWLIYQQHGFAKPNEVPDTLLNAYYKGDLHVLPQGGVALPLGKRLVSSKAYNFLPLPIDTGLPVHVNGAIELDERRRDIWRVEGDARAQWNRQLMKQIVSPAYVKALCCLQAKIMTRMEGSKDESEMQDIVSSYTAFLPVTAENSFWKELIEDIYRTIADSAKPMFPSIRRSVSYNRDGDDTNGVNNVRTLEWRTPLTESQMQGFFDSPIGTDRSLRSVVSDLGFPLIECSQNVQTIFSDSLQDCRKGDILEITPAHLISHLSSNAVEDVGLAPMELPKQLSDTVIQDTATLGVILKYCCCSQCDNFKDNVEALPLLATSDGILRTFSTETPVYITEFDYLFPSSRSEFLETSIKKYFNEDFDVICHFDIPCVASLMREELCPIKFECDQYVQWDKTEPTEKWITGLWECLAACRNPDDELTCLSKWSILPCRKNGDMGVTHHLVPLSKATSVMYKLSGMSHILGALSSLRVSEVDRSLDFEEAEQLITKIVAHEDRPDAVLAVFDHVIQTNAGLFDRLTTTQRDHILQYLTTHMPERLVENVDNRRIIMNLPCYEQIDGTYVSLSHTSTVYVVNANLPIEEMTKWMAVYNDIFLREDVGLKELFKAIGCVFVSECDTLSKFIFPKFHLLSSEVRLKHLENISRHRCQIEGGVEKCMKLGDFPLLEGNDGVLRFGKEFFDRRNTVFATMLTEICRQLCGDLFQPHLYQLPDGLIHYSKLLYSLGSTPTPSFPQLTTVLNGLASHSGIEMKNPNMLKATIAASQLFLQQIESLTSAKLNKASLQADLEGIQIVHLPASSKGKLLPSTEIFIKDETDHTKRLVESNVPFLPDEVTKLLTNVHALVDSMPKHLKPRSVKACVTERIDSSARPCLHQQVSQCKFYTRLNGLMTSKEFDEAIQRLLEVSNHQSIDKLKNLRLQCMAELPTSLFVDGERIEGSEAKSRFCMSYDDDDAEKACIRVLHTGDNERSAYMEVVKGIAQAILRHVGGIGQEHLPFLVDMLSADSSREIPKLLRSYKLIKTDGRAAEHDEGMAPPKLGSRIPSDTLHLLEQDPYLGFFKGEYVAYQINTDIDIHVIPIHVYAQVLDVPENLLSPLRNKYLIDIGEEYPVWVSGLDLFKFLMPEESVDTGMEIMVYCHSSDGQGPEGQATPETPPTTEAPPRTEVPPKPQPYPENIEEAKEQVSDQLEEIWELDEEERKKAVRRMYLRWHPDKHPDERKHLATEVFKHLQNEIERLKAGIKRTGQAGKSQGSSSGPRGGGDFFDDDFDEFMRNWARQEGRWRESYNRSYRDRGYFGNARSRHYPPSFDDTPEPDMPRASTWFKQAKSDLSASSNDLGKEANEWVCFKSYHAAEKALKAAQFASRGTSNPSHNLDVLVTDLMGHFRDKTVTDRARQLNILVDVNDCMYPGASIFRHRVPCERFSQSDAERARQCASDIVEEIRKHFKF